MANGIEISTNGVKVLLSKAVWRDMVWLVLMAWSEMRRQEFQPQRPRTARARTRMVRDRRHAT